MTTTHDLSASADTSADTLLTGGCQRQLTPTYGTPPAARSPLTPHPTPCRTCGTPTYGHLCRTCEPRERVVGRRHLGWTSWTR